MTLKISQIVANAGEPAVPALSHTVPVAGALASSVSSGDAVVPHSPLAQKIPKPKMTGNTVKDMAAKHDHGLMVECVNILQAHPWIRSDCRGFLCEALREKKRDAEDSDAFFKELSSLGKVDEGWMVSWVCNKTGFLPAELGKARLQDKDCLQNIVDFLLAATKTLKLPQSCRRKVILCVVLDKRVEVAGNRHTLVQDHSILKNDKINLLIFVYKINFVEGKGKTVCHRPTMDVAQIPEGVAITRDFELVSAHSDFNAHVSNGPHHIYHLFKFFNDKEGPHKIKIINGNSKDFNEHVKLADQQQIIEDKKASVAASPVQASQTEAEAYASPQQKVMQERMKRARSKMQVNGEEQAQKRRMSLQARLSMD